MGERVNEDDQPAHRCTGSSHLSGKSEHPSGQSECPRKCGGSQLSQALAGLLGAARNQGGISPHPCSTTQGACPAPQLHTGLTASALSSWPVQPQLQTDRRTGPREPSTLATLDLPSLISRGANGGAVWAGSQGARSVGTSPSTPWTPALPRWPLTASCRGPAAR